MSDVVGPPTYAVTKVVRGAGGRWFAGKPTHFTDVSAALSYAKSFADKEKKAKAKGEGVRITVTQGATLVREYKT